MTTPLLTVANQLTLLRMGMAPLLVVLVLGRELQWALAVFVIAGLTDLLDGLVARRGHQQTTLGAVLDPIADKVLLSSAFIALTWAPALPAPIPAWVTVVILSRDVIILASVAAVNLTVGHRVFYPSLLGKLSTALQIVTAGVALLMNAVTGPLAAGRALYVLTVAVTVASALHYVWRASTGRGIVVPGDRPGGPA
jgi:cardiolipin synthase